MCSPVTVAVSRHVTRASQQQLSNQASSIHNMFGSGQIPYILPKPHVVKGGATFNAP